MWCVPERGPCLSGVVGIYGVARGAIRAGNSNGSGLAPLTLTFRASFNFLGTDNSTSFYLVHAMPTDPLFGYCPENSERWQTEIGWNDAEVLVVGHTHTPFIRKIEKTTIVNPGSVGQPKPPA